MGPRLCSYDGGAIFKWTNHKIHPVSSRRKKKCFLKTTHTAFSALLRLVCLSQKDFVFCQKKCSHTAPQLWRIEAGYTPKIHRKCELSCPHKMCTFFPCICMSGAPTMLLPLPRVCVVTCSCLHSSLLTVKRVSGNGPVWSFSDLFFTSVFGRCVEPQVPLSEPMMWLSILIGCMCLQDVCLHSSKTTMKDCPSPPSHPPPNVGCVIFEPCII